MTLPRSIGPYRPLHRIGAGGMGTVYFAYHPVTGKPSAVKVLSPDYANDRHYRQRFIREVEVLRRISGPYLVPLVDADTQAEVPWLAMPYVPGETLQQHVQSHGALRERISSPSPPRSPWRLPTSMQPASLTGTSSTPTSYSRRTGRASSTSASPATSTSQPSPARPCHDPAAPAGWRPSN